MSELSRFGISIDNKLLESFDKRNEKRGYKNRSEAIRDLIRDCLVEEVTDSSDTEMVGIVSLVYDHHKLELPKRLTDEQHKNHSLILSTLHIHLDQHNCLEVLLIKGSADKIREISDQFLSLKGIKHGKLVLTSTGKELS